MQETYPSYAENFPVWANQSSGMLHLSLWTALRELGIGATVQHYNPVIDEAVRKRFDLPGYFPPRTGDFLNKEKLCPTAGLFYF